MTGNMDPEQFRACVQAVGGTIGAAVGQAFSQRRERTTLYPDPTLSMERTSRGQRGV